MSEPCGSLYCVCTSHFPHSTFHVPTFTLVGGNSQTRNSRGRESMGIPWEFPFLKWRFLGIPRNSNTGKVYWLYRGYFYLQGGHSNAHITAISSFTPSSTACPVGVQFLPWKRGGSALRSSTTTYCGMLLWSREHRSSMTMYMPKRVMSRMLMKVCSFGGSRRTAPGRISQALEYVNSTPNFY